MLSVGINLLVTETVVHKVMGRHGACERNHVWDIFVINSEGGDYLDLSSVHIYLCSGRISFENIPIRLDFKTNGSLSNPYTQQ